MLPAAVEVVFSLTFVFFDLLVSGGAIKRGPTRAADLRFEGQRPSLFHAPFFKESSAVNRTIIMTRRRRALSTRP
jgi:hypothetical protein